MLDPMASLPIVGNERNGSYGSEKVDLGADKMRAGLDDVYVWNRQNFDVLLR